MARIILALALCGAVLALAPAAAQNENPAIPMAPPAPYDDPTGSVAPVVPKDQPAESKETPPAEIPPQVGAAPAKPPAESKTPESPPVETNPHSGTAPENKPADNTDSRFTFTRMND